MLSLLSPSLFRRPSGNPRNDFTEAAGAAIRISAIPEFEKMYSEVSALNGTGRERAGRVTLKSVWMSFELIQNSI